MVARARRWAVALSARHVAIGATAITAGTVANPREEYALGAGAVYATYGSALVTLSAIELARTKRQSRSRTRARWRIEGLTVLF
jgi:hypothetical protein